MAKGRAASPEMVKLRNRIINNADKIKSAMESQDKRGLNKAVKSVLKISEQIAPNTYTKDMLVSFGVEAGGGSTRASKLSKVLEMINALPINEMNSVITACEECRTEYEAKQKEELKQTALNTLSALSPELQAEILASLKK